MTFVIAFILCCSNNNNKHYNKVLLVFPAVYNNNYAGSRCTSYNVEGIDVKRQVNILPTGQSVVNTETDRFPKRKKKSFLVFVPGSFIIISNTSSSRAVY